MQMFGVPRGWILWVWWVSDLSSSLILLWNDCYQLLHVFHVLREMHPINFDDLPILSTGANLKLTAWFFAGEIFSVIRQNNPLSCVFYGSCRMTHENPQTDFNSKWLFKKLSSHLICHDIIVPLYRLPEARLRSLKEHSETFCIVFAKLYFPQKKVFISEIQNRFLHIPLSITVLQISAQKKSQWIRDVLVTCYIMQN